MSSLWENAHEARSKPFFPAECASRTSLPPEWHINSQKSQRLLFRVARLTSLWPQFYRVYQQGVWRALGARDIDSWDYCPHLKKVRWLGPLGEFVGRLYGRACRKTLCQDLLVKKPLAILSFLLRCDHQQTPSQPLLIVQVSTFLKASYYAAAEFRSPAPGQKAHLKSQYLKIRSQKS